MTSDIAILVLACAAWLNRTQERPHAGLDGAVIEPDPLFANRSGAIARKDQFGGLLTMYHRVAA